MRALRLLRFVLWSLAAALTAAAGPVAVRAQDNPEEEKSALIRWVEDTISTPDRRISLGRIDGVLSSDARIASITIADRQGVWLTIEGVHLVWSRLALLSGTLDITSLEAQSITIARKPLPPEGIEPASSGFSLPELPVEVKIGKIAVPAVNLPAEIAGEDTTIAVDGGGSLVDNKLQAAITVDRTRPAGGRLALRADFDGATRQLALDLTFDEPQNGLVSNLLDIPGRPALAFSIAGSGPLDRFAATIGLSADGERLLAGTATIAQGQAGLEFAAELSGTLSRLVSPAYGAFFSGTSSVSIAVRQAEGGGFALDRAAVRSGLLTVDLAGTVSADGFPTAIRANGRLADAGGQPVQLPGGTTVGAVTFDAGFGDGTWRADFAIDRLATGAVNARRAAVAASGIARDLEDAARRSLTFAVDGRAEDLGSNDPALASALGRAFTLAARGAWQAGRPVAIDEVRFANAAANAHFAGRLEGVDLIGAYTLEAPDLRPFAGLAGAALAGSVSLGAEGSVAIAGGAFSLKLDGRADNLKLGAPAFDRLFAGRTTLGGEVGRGEQGLRVTDLTLANERARVRLDGIYGVKTADIRADVRLADAATLTERASGALSLTAALTGDQTRPSVAAELAAPRLVLQGKTLSDFVARFDGTLPRGGIDGAFRASGSLDRVAVVAAADIATEADGTKRVSGLTATAGSARLSGDLGIRPNGTAEGRLAVDARDIAAVAPLFLARASGALAADVTLSAEGGRQDAAVKAVARALKVETLSIGSADADLTARDLMGAPAVAGTVKAATVVAGEASVASVDARATAGEGGATLFDVTASGVRAAALATAGVPDLRVTAKGRLARNVVSLDAAARAGDALSLTAIGDVPLAGPGLSLAVKGTVSLALANRALAERGARATGTAAVDARVTGSLAAPEAEGAATIAGATFTDPDSGMRLTGIAGRFRLAGDRATIERLSASTEGGGTVAVTGSLQLKPDLPADLAIVLRNARVSDGRIVTAQIGGDLSVTGPLLGGPRVAGRLAIARAEITIPERFPANAAALGVKHLKAPPEVRRTLAKAGLAGPRAAARRPAGDLTLDITIEAPARIFVRGRGLDAELGGQVALRGPIANLAPVGSFSLRRGALSVIGQRISLDRGTVMLVGTLDPLIDFTASASSGSITVTASVVGPASDPQILLSSVPELPQDEILAQFLFGRSISDLTPAQIVQLATAVAQLAGGGGGDLLSSIRKSTGLDNLSIGTDSEGNAAVQAGRYIGENIYLGVTTGASGETNATINLDITRNLKARAEAGTEGSKAGVFYEREY